MSLNYWHREFETLPRDEIKKIQLERLKKTVEYAYHNSPVYRQKLDKAKVKPEDIKSLDDIQRLPFTTKEDFRLNYPFGMFAVPLEEVVRIHSSSGTTGKPTVVGYTKNDIKIWSELVSRIAVAGGVTKNDVVQIAFGYGLFTGGFGLHYGIENIGAMVVPVSSGNTQRQIMIMKDFGTTTLICTPSYALHIAEVMEEEGISPKELNIRIGLFGAEPWSDNMRREIEKKLNIKAYDNYGLSETIGPGVSGECIYQSGLHIWEDYFYVEVIDPHTGEQLPEGEKGELVITPLFKEALPVLRYRTRDITRLIPEPCKCGRTMVRMERVSGRTDDMLIVKGVNVFPSQIESVLLEVEGVLPQYQIIVDRSGAMDDMEIKIEVSENIFFDEMKRLTQIKELIRKKIEGILGLSAKITLVEPKTLERSVGKAKRVIDRRKI